MAKVAQDLAFSAEEIDTTQFKCGDDTIIVEVSDTMRGMFWRMTVNGKVSHWYSYYQGVLVHEGYGLASAYWVPSFQEFVPFKITYSVEK